MSATVTCSRTRAARATRFGLRTSCGLGSAVLITAAPVGQHRQHAHERRTLGLGQWGQHALLRAPNRRFYIGQQCVAVIRENCVKTA